MADLAESGATLTISGPGLQPDEMTRRLGAAPTRAETGRWELRAPSLRPGDLNAQIVELFAGLAADPALWTALAADYALELHATLYLDTAQESAALSPETVAGLAARGVVLRLEIYAPFTPSNSCGG